MAFCSGIGEVRREGGRFDACIWFTEHELPYVMVMSRGGFVNGIARDSKSIGSGSWELRGAALG